VNAKGIRTCLRKKNLLLVKATWGKKEGVHVKNAWRGKGSMAADRLGFPRKRGIRGKCGSMEKKLQVGI